MNKLLKLRIMSNSTGNTFLVLTGAVIELEFYLLPIKDQNQRKMKDGFDDVKNDLKNKLDHASEEFKDKFSTAKN
jgi:hypothetical protein